MAFTMRDVVDKGRKPLNDVDKVTYSDPDLLGYANDAILLLRNRRPDLFIGQWSALPENIPIDDPFPLPSEYVPAVADYITARAETHNDESVIEQRAELFFKLVNGQI